MYHSEVRWLSREVLKRLNLLKPEGSPFSKLFESESFLYSMGYLANIFGQINIVSRGIQGPHMTMIDANEKLKAFLDKLPLWKCRLEAGTSNYYNFRMLEDVILMDQTQRDVLFLNLNEGKI